MKVAFNRHRTALVAIAAALFCGAVVAGLGRVLDMEAFWLAAASAGITVLMVGRSGILSVGCRAQSLESMSEEIDHIMIGAAETSYFVDTIKKKMEEDLHKTDEIVGSAEQNAATIRQIAENAKRASQAAANVRDESTAGAIEIDRGLRLISDARRDAEVAVERMASLQKQSQEIQKITDLINEIAAGTNLLALNAAIEAVHAGPHGRGFAVVAGEVKKLAERTKAATQDIGVMVQKINLDAERAADGMGSLNGKVSEAASTVERVHTFLSNIEKLASGSEGEVQQIAAASQEQVDATGVINKAILQIRDNMRSTEAQLPQATDSAMMLAERAEALFETLTNANVPTAHDHIRAAAAKAAKDVERLFEQAVAGGQISIDDLFDRNYVAIPRTNPPKYSTRFDQFTDRVLPALQEQVLADFPNLAYAGAVDNNGYFPTHNKKFSQPLTGKYDVDLVNNRTKRIFSDRTGTRCGSNTKPFLMQTYKRDTGEVMHDLSVPIRIAGRHWGGFRIGYKSIAPAAKVPASAPPPTPARKAMGMSERAKPRAVVA